MSFGYFKGWVSPYWDVKLSSLAPSVIVLLVEHHLLNLTLKSRMMTVRKGFYPYQYYEIPCHLQWKLYLYDILV